MISGGDDQTSSQYALLTWLAREFGGKGTLGKKAIQKLVYILEAVLKLRTGYSFQLYTYGPFSRDLAGDIDILDRLQAIKVEYIPSENRYVVSRGTNDQKTMKSGRHFLDDNSDKLRILKERFGSKSGRELELFCTLHFLAQAYSHDSSRDIAARLTALKPKYTVEEAEEMLKSVRQTERTVADSLHPH
jgi:uncharacterized protein YwgA